MIDELEKNDVSLKLVNQTGDFFDEIIIGEERLPLLEEKSPENVSENLNFITNHLAERQDVPGASLTNDPEKPYPWEQPPQFANPQEALRLYWYTLLSTPEVAGDIVTALTQGVSVMDLTSLFVFTGFVSGKFTPDVGLLIGEPTAYFIMGIGEMANIEYKIEDDDTDLDEFIEKDITDEIMKNNMERIRQLSNKNKVQKGDVPKEVLAEVEQRVDTSLLAPTETEDNNLLDRTE